jgi:hypothetical protein
MFQTEWPVLLVDDDPDVLAVSKLAMKSFEIDGVRSNCSPPPAKRRP